ncbi:MAG: MBL fold metallo-hydrolase [Burkholderiales bacterium]
MAPAMQVDGYEIDVLIQGFPGRMVCHGGLGWSTVALIRGRGRVALVDVGSFNMRKGIIEQLARRGLKPGDVTDVLLTHSHYDHSLNWIMFRNARIVIGAQELAWSLNEPWGEGPVPELYVRELQGSPNLKTVADAEEVMPGVSAHIAPGHTPGHLVFVLRGADRDAIFTGDAAKNRAELLSRRADATYDSGTSSASIGMIWEFWRRREGSILVPGHDIPMTQNGGRPQYLGKREPALKAWFGDDIETTTLIELTVASR